MTLHEAQQQLLFQLYHLYDNREAANIADWVLEHLTGWKKIDRIVHKQVLLSTPQVQQLETYTAALLRHQPVQYVLQEAWFDGMKFFVNEAVLIPRPETEELVHWIASSFRGAGLTILDIGTGSGCIPIALKKKLPAAQLYACDISETALAVAQKNGAIHQAAVQWMQLDILDPKAWPSLPPVDLLVSNPPYIPVKDKSSMQHNVLQYEPHLALFVEDEDPLLFYRTIAALATEKLLPGGSVFVEIHEDLGEKTQQLLLDKGFTSVELKKDMQGKDRMIRGSR